MSLTVTPFPTPNQDERPADAGPIDTLVMHYTGMKSAREALERMRDPVWKVSAHWCVDEDGTVYRLVPEEMRAWHAGISWWRGRRDLNDTSIGIEIVNPGHEFGYRPFPPAQMNALIRLCHAIQIRHVIDPRNVVGHSDIAPSRKQDPGELFDWARLAQEGIGHWPAPVAEPGPALSIARPEQGRHVRDWQKRFAQFGYGLYEDSVFGEETEYVVTAFQRHFRQARVDGVLDPGTGAILKHMVESDGA